MLSSLHITKPFYIASLIDRPRLYVQLDRWESVRALLIHAPAGYGKSSLVSRWIDVRNHNPYTAWVALDERDNDPHYFIQHLAAALDQVVPRATASVEPILHDTQGSGDRALLRLFSLFAGGEESAAAGQRQLMIVLDDLHCIESPGVQTLLMTCLEQGPANLHLVLLSRIRPVLPLARLYAHGSIAVLCDEDLRFTEDEVHAYLARQGFVDPSHVDLAQLTERSGGWITALQLAVLARRGQADCHDLLTALQSANTWLADFLTDEVLDRQTPAVRDFLLQTSLLDAFNAELCAAVTGMGHAYARLVEIARADLFLIELDRPGWYRYHELFQEFLQHRLQAQVPAAGVAELHSRAAEWLAGAGQVRSAIHHWLAAGARAEAAELVERRMRPLLVRDVHEAQALLALLPQSVLVQRPRLMIDRCMLAMMCDHSHVLPFVQEAEDAVKAQLAAGSAAPQFKAELLVLRAGGYFLQRDLAAATRTAGQARAHLSDLDDLYSGTLYFLEMHLYRYAGELRESLRSAEAALAAYLRIEAESPIVALRREIARWHMLAGNSAEAARLFAQLFGEWGHRSLPVAREMFYAYCYGAENSYWQNQLAQAQAWQQAALDMAQALQDHDLLQVANWLGKIVRAERHTAEEPYTAGLAAAAQPAVTDVLGLFIRYQAYRLVTNGQSDAAWRALQQAGMRLETLAGEQAHRKLVAYLHVYVARGVDLEAVTPLLAGALEDAVRTGGRLPQLQILALSAWQQLQLGDVGAATAVLARAASLAAATGYSRVLLDIPALAQLPIQQPVSSPAVPPSSLPAGAMTGALTGALTGQEMHVLRLLAADYTYAQIAGELVISLNTVRTHVSSIYRKLGVHRRSEAVALARR